MKITLDLDPTSLSTEVSEFIKQLTDEDKKAMVKQVVEEYYADYRKFESGELQSKEQALVEQVKNNLDSYDKDRYKTDDQIRNHYKFIEEKKKFKTFSQTTREEISNKIRIELKENIDKFIKEDPEYQALLKESMQAVKERFPLMVQTMMLAHFASQLPNVTNLIHQELGNVFDRLNQVEQKLLR